MQTCSTGQRTLLRTSKDILINVQYHQGLFTLIWCSEVLYPACRGQSHLTRTDRAPSLLHSQPETLVNTANVVFSISGSIRTQLCIVWADSFYRKLFILRYCVRTLCRIFWWVVCFRSLAGKLYKWQGTCQWTSQLYCCCAVLQTHSD